MTTKTLSTSDLAQFTGSENWYRHGINRNVLYTDGAQHVAEHGEAYWLLDEIAIIQPYNKAVAAEEFQVWKLAVRGRKGFGWKRWSTQWIYDPLGLPARESLGHQIFAGRFT
jgi:hypothetical protein